MLILQVFHSIPVRLATRLPAADRLMPHPAVKLPNKLSTKLAVTAEHPATAPTSQTSRIIYLPIDEDHQHQALPTDMSADVTTWTWTLPMSFATTSVQSSIRALIVRIALPTQATCGMVLCVQVARLSSLSTHPILGASHRLRTSPTGARRTQACDPDAETTTMMTAVEPHEVLAVATVAATLATNPPSAAADTMTLAMARADHQRPPPAKAKTSNTPMLPLPILL